jgi:hypothetical protein
MMSGHRAEGKKVIPGQPHDSEESRLIGSWSATISQKQEAEAIGCFVQGWEAPPSPSTGT